MSRHRRVMAIVLPVLLGSFLLVAPAAAADPLTVAQAIGTQNGSVQAVRGYVVGQPTGATTVLFGNFTGDTALAIADSAAERDPADMIYVQVTSAYRSSFGLQSNPGRVGALISVTGTLTAYFSHAGLKSPTAMTAGGGGGTTPPPGNDYYAAATGKSGAALKTALNQIVSRGVTTLSYDAVWNALKVTDQDPNNANNVVLLYSGISRSKNLNGGDSGDWNREHVWAQSHGNFGTGNGPGTDLHHLRPEDVGVNAARGNKDFDTGGTTVSGAPGNRADGDSWEPRAAVRGDVARMIFYMDVRYEGGTFPDLEVDDATSSGSAPRMGRLSALRQWHQQDPPDAAERRRNEIIFSTYQHNRNPFIDHPEWVGSIW